MVFVGQVDNLNYLYRLLAHTSRPRNQGNRRAVDRSWAYKFRWLGLVVTELGVAALSQLVCPRALGQMSTKMATVRRQGHRLRRSYLAWTPTDRYDRLRNKHCNLLYFLYLRAHPHLHRSYLGWV